MIVREIVRTCSNPFIARAAVASIGGDFERTFSKDAETRHLSSGLLASGLVREFARCAEEEDWNALRDATRGADMPILSGLRYILDRARTLESDDSIERMSAPPPPILWCEARSCV